MIAKNNSLTKQLAWRLIFLQALIIFAFSSVITFTVFSGNISYIDERVPRTILDAVHVNESGNLELHVDKKIQKLLHDAPALWFVVEDAQRHRLEYGRVPDVYRPLLASLYRLVPSEIHEGTVPYDLTMRVYVGPDSGGSLRIICGGVPSTDLVIVFFGLLYYFGWRIILPMTLLTLIMVPWLIRRGMSGLAEVAAQAQAIDIDVQGARLADQAVPRELQPLVQAFNAALERLNEGYDARDRFLAGAAHELRAPIAILEARIETLESGANRTRLLADVARLSNLAEQLLDLQRLGKQQSAFEPLDLVALSREVAADVAPLAVDGGYDLALDAPETRVMVMGDRQSLSRALTNLIQNAIAHGGGHGLITVDVKQDGTLGVSDQGPGIPAEERHRIFEPFYRMRPSSTGAGLGLHLVQEIIALHGGRIEVIDADGGGAYFRMRLLRVS